MCVGGYVMGWVSSHHHSSGHRHLPIKNAQDDSIIYGCFQK